MKRSALALTLVPLVLAPLALVFGSTPVHSGPNGDTLTTILRPLPNLPSIVRKGDSFRVWANAASTASGFNGALSFGGLVIPLLPPSGGYQTSKLRWELDFAVPAAGVPEETYDLILSANAIPPDTAQHAVRVVASYPSTFYFAQVSDTHLPAHGFSSDGGFDPADTTAFADFNAVIDDLNLIHPEFVLHTGDLVNEGELEEYLGMYEMANAQRMLSRLRDPIYVVPGNHDQGGWQATPPPDGTAKQNWWRQFGWKFLLSPPPGYPYHSQNYSFDFGNLHVIGMETYINNGAYDHYRQDIWGAQSFTAEQMSWLSSDLAAVPAGRAKLLFYHYDFGGTMPNGSPGANFSQINPGALGLSGAIWGHNHGVSEGALGAQPFNLGLQAVIDGRRAFRIFRVSGTTITPGPMHKAGGSSFTPTDSLTTVWNGPNNGTRSQLTATVTNRYQETWDRAQLVFHMVDHDSTYVATGGTIRQAIESPGRFALYVDAVLPATGVKTVSVSAIPTSVDPGPAARFALGAPIPNPFHPSLAALTVRFAVPAETEAEIAIFDLSGRLVARAFSGRATAGEHTAEWDGRETGGARVKTGLYLVRLRAAGLMATRKLVLTH